MAAPIAAVVDFRVRNLASTRVRGLDVNVEHSITSDYGTFDFGLNGTRLLSFTQSTSADSPALDLANTVGNPLKLRVHASLGWCQRRCDMPGFGADFSVNYSGPYEDRQNSYVRAVASFATLDAAVSYRTAHPEGYLGDIEVVLSASNLLDEPPPFVNREIGYDVINAEPYGRVLSLSVSKRW
jgi:iron complex outermembrane receptor protein